MKPLLDLSAPIIPVEGLGGVVVGANIGDYRELLWAADINHMVWVAEGKATGDWRSFSGLWQASLRLPQMYDWTDAEHGRSFDAHQALLSGAEGADLRDPEQPDRGMDALEIDIDVRTGAIVAVTALLGYEGALFDALGTGMTGAEAMAAEPRLEEWPASEALVMPDVRGVIVPVGDLSQGEVESIVIDAIRVFDPTLSEEGVLHA